MQAFLREKRLAVTTRFLTLTWTIAATGKPAALSCKQMKPKGNSQFQKSPFMQNRNLEYHREGGHTFLLCIFEGFLKNQRAFWLLLLVPCRVDSTGYSIK